MHDHWQRYAAEERVRQLETELREARAQRDAARKQVRDAVLAGNAARGLVVELVERYGRGFPRDLRERIKALG